MLKIGNTNKTGPKSYKTILKINSLQHSDSAAICHMFNWACHLRLWSYSLRLPWINSGFPSSENLDPQAGVSEFPKISAFPSHMVPSQRRNMDSTHRYSAAFMFKYNRIWSMVSKNLHWKIFMIFCFPYPVIFSGHTGRLHLICE